MFSQPNSHSTQRALSPLPSMVRIACALRWKLKDSRRKIAGVEPPPSQRHIHGCFCANAAAPGAAPPHCPDCGLPPPLDSPPPAPPACSCAIYMPFLRLSALLGRFPWPIPPLISPNVCTGAQQRHHLPQAELTQYADFFVLLRAI